MKTIMSGIAIGLIAVSVQAAGDLTRQEPNPVTIVLGNAQGEHRFSPDSLTLETGKLYALRLENRSGNDYYFGSQGLADAVFSRKVMVKAADGRTIAEIYGPVRRFEVKAGGVIEWWFLPVRTGRFEDVMSTRTHADAGMRATIEVK